MQTTVQKWGNSLAVRIPASFCKEMDLSAGSLVEINSVNHLLVFKPLKKKYNLTELMGMVNETNLHHEVETGETKGREIW